MTLIETLMALAVAGVVMGGLMTAFIAQQRVYRTQMVTTALQQNMRTAMQMITEDIRMAGYYTSMDTRACRACMNWDPGKKGEDDFSPMVNGINQLTGVSRYRSGTDVIMIVKASSDAGVLQPGEQALSKSNILDLSDLDLDNDGDEDLNASGRPFGVTVKADFTRALVFKIDKVDTAITVQDRFTESYSRGDIIARADIIIYRVDDKNPSFPGSVLERKNAGNGNQFQVVAEGIYDLQFRYILSDGREVDDLPGEERRVQAVKVVLRGEKEVPGKGTIHREMASLVRIRNAI
jgi:type II secretory pathway pseudopilin PulG